jgi:hypothetical protein
MNLRHSDHPFRAFHVATNCQPSLTSCPKQLSFCKVVCRVRSCVEQSACDPHFEFKFQRWPRIEALMKHAIRIAVYTLLVCGFVGGCGGGGGSGAKVDKLTIVGSGS